MTVKTGDRTVAVRSRVVAAVASGWMVARYYAAHSAARCTGVDFAVAQSAANNGPLPERKPGRHSPAALSGKDRAAAQNRAPAETDSHCWNAASDWEPVGANSFRAAR